MKNVLLLFVWLAGVSGQIIWGQRARVHDFREFFASVMQETVYELERIGFSTLKLINVTHEINERMYNWDINGTAVYTNGFLVSIQKIEVTTITQGVGSPTINGMVTPRAFVTGTLSLMDATLGYDVIFTPKEGDVQRYTGEYRHNYITLRFQIVKDLRNNEISVTTTPGTSGGLHRMVYSPSTNVTEVLGRTFRPFHNSDGVSRWYLNINPIILDVLRNKVEFPKVCYGHC